MRRSLVSILAALAVVAALAGCGQKQTATDTSMASSDSMLSSNPVEQPQGNITPEQGMTPAQSAPEQTAPAPAPRPATHTPSTPRHSSSGSSGGGSSTASHSTGTRVDAGTALNVAIDSQISSETANVGDTWTGTLKDNIIVGDKVVFPAGSTVTGTVTEAVAAQKGSLARLGVAITAITANGNKTAIEAGTEPIEAGSPRARNLGAMAGGAAAGALIGKAVGGGGKGALIGGLIGAAGAGAAVARSKGYQVVLKEGTVVTFNVKSPVTVRS
jgi:hypothetical protein